MDYSALNKCLSPQYLAYLEVMKLRSDTKRDREAVEEEQTQALLDNLIRSGEIKRCPYCSVMIQRNGGCRKVLCREYRCKFCWNCLEMKTHGCACRADRHLWLDNTTNLCEDVGNWEVLPVAVAAMRPDDDKVVPEPESEPEPQRRRTGVDRAE